jgi:hypothetical protein
MKLSIDNCCKFHGCMLLSQTRAAYVRCWASFSQGLGRHTFCGGTGTGEQAAECPRGLTERLPPPSGQSLAMADACAQTPCTFCRPPQGMTPLWAQRLIEHNEAPAALEITYRGGRFRGREGGSMPITLPRFHHPLHLPAERLDRPPSVGLPEQTRPLGHTEVPCPPGQRSLCGGSAFLLRRLFGASPSRLDERLWATLSHKTRGSPLFCPQEKSLRGPGALHGGEKSGPRQRLPPPRLGVHEGGGMIAAPAPVGPSCPQAGQSLALNGPSIKEKPAPLWC